MNELQQRIHLFCLHHGLIAPPEQRLLDVQSELGEVSKEVLKGTEYGKKGFTVTEDLPEELGDLLFAVVQFANEAKIDLQDSVEAVMKKYEKRIAANGDAGSGR